MSGGRPGTARAVRDATRIFRHATGLAITAVFTLTVGIAAPTAMFSLATGILGELPFDEPHELVEIEVNDLPAGRTDIGATGEDLEAWDAAQASFEGLAATYRTVFQVGGAGGRPDRIRGARISPAAFDLLGVSPVLGRLPTDADAESGAVPVALLGYEVWKDRFALDPAVVGRQIRVDDETRTIAGIMPEGFEFPRREHLWVPIRRGPIADTLRTSVFGRLRDGVSADAARAELDVIAANLAGARPDTHRDLTISVHTFGHAELGDGEATVMLYAMTLVLSFTLVVACANVAHLLLVRALERRREVAVRMALGAGRSRILGDVLAESLVLSLAGGVAGVALSYATVAWLDARLADAISLFWAKVEVDGAVLAFVAVLVVVAALMAGVVPARQTSSIRLIDALTTRGGARGVRARRTTAALVGAQVAFSCGLLILSGLMVRGVIGLATRGSPFGPDGVFTARVELRDFDYPRPEDRRAFIEDLSREMSEASTAGGVALASGLPGLGPALRPIELEGETGRPAREAGVLAVNPEFFATFRGEPSSGRLFSAADAAGSSRRVAVVTDVFVDRFLPDRPPLGRRFRLTRDTTTPARVGTEPGGDDDGWVEIVGVVRDGGVFAEPTRAHPGVFLPMSQETPANVSVALRTPDPATAAARVRDAVARIDPDLPVYDAMTLRDAILRTSTVQRTFGWLFGAFGVVALLMAVVGLYGVVAFGVRRRTHEVGMRTALGASRRRIVGLLLGSAAGPVAGGLVVGVGLAAAIAPALGAALFGISPHDPGVYVVVAAALCLATLTAALIPAVRAAGMHPMHALRSE